MHLYRFSGHGEKWREQIIGHPIKIHQGGEEIGGTCIEVFYRDQRLLLDFGTPFWFDDALKKLGNSARETLIEAGLLPKIPGLYRYDGAPPVRCILLSHPHLDHYGHILYKQQQIPLLMPRDTHQMFEVYWTLTREPHRSLRSSFKCVDASQVYEVEGTDMRISFHRVDHSHLTSYGIFIETPECRIVFTGDLRLHGTRVRDTEEFIRKAREFNPHYLIIEGTQCQSDPARLHGCDSEHQVAEEFDKLMKHTAGDVLMWGTTTHLDRAKLFYQAARASGRLFVMGFPLAYYASRAIDLGLINSFPHIERDDCRLFFRQKELKMARAGRRPWCDFLDRAISREQMTDHSFAFIGTNDAIWELLPFNDKSAIIYSMYCGYLKPGDFAAGFDLKAKKAGATFHKIHTSGHATFDDLKKIVLGISPQYVVPMHTTSPQSFLCPDIVDAGIKVLIGGEF